MERVLEVENGYLVQFRAFNQGGSAAAELTIEGEVAGADGSNEVSKAVLDYVPARSGREGELWFSGDPRGRAAHVVRDRLCRAVIAERHRLFRATSQLPEMTTHAPERATAAAPWS